LLAPFKLNNKLGRAMLHHFRCCNYR